MRLVYNWREILRKAWSVRFMVLAGALTAAEVVVPLFAEDMPRNVFAVLSAVSVTGALIARVYAQKDAP
jgi:hypothetical protein